jgi:hypothetical protein
MASELATQSFLVSSVCVCVCVCVFERITFRIHFQACWLYLGAGQRVIEHMKHHRTQVSQLRTQAANSPGTKDVPTIMQSHKH